MLRIARGRSEGGGRWSGLEVTDALYEPAFFIQISCYLTRWSLCEIINSTLGMPIHGWIGALYYFAPASNSRVNKAREWCISVSAFLPNAFRNEAMSVSS